MSTAEELRNAVLGQRTNFKKVLVQLDGMKFELRQPSQKKRAQILKAAGATTLDRKTQGTTLDTLVLQMHAVVECVFEPGTDKQVFAMSDCAAMAELPTGGLFEKLAEKALEMMNIDQEAVEKNS